MTVAARDGAVTHSADDRPELERELHLRDRLDVRCRRCPSGRRAIALRQLELDRRRAIVRLHGANADATGSRRRLHPRPRHRRRPTARAGGRTAGRRLHPSAVPRLRPTTHRHPDWPTQLLITRELGAWAVSSEHRGLKQGEPGEARCLLRNPRSGSPTRPRRSDHTSRVGRAARPVPERGEFRGEEASAWPFVRAQRLADP